MDITIQQTINVLEGLNDAAKTSVLRFAEFLASEKDDDIAFYDAAKTNDDGYRISSNDLRKKYGI